MLYDEIMQVFKNKNMIPITQNFDELKIVSYDTRETIIKYYETYGSLITSIEVILNSDKYKCAILNRLISKKQINTPIDGNHNNVQYNILRLQTMNSHTCECIPIIWMLINIKMMHKNGINMYVFDNVELMLFPP
jgi:hypothetical protein